MDEEKKIVQEVLRSSEAGSKLLLAEYRDRLYAIAFGLSGDSSHAEDLVLRTVERVLDKVESYSGEDSFFNWMCVILLNLHRDENRGKVRQGTFLAGSVKDMDSFIEPSESERIVNEVDCGIVRQILEHMPDNMREVLLLHYFDNQPVAKIAKYLSVSQGTVKSRLYYARMMLARRLGVGIKRGVVALASAAVLAVLSSVAMTLSLGGERAAGSDEAEDGNSSASVNGILSPSEEQAFRVTMFPVPSYARSLNPNPEQGEFEMTDSKSVAARFLAANVMLAATMSMAGDSVAGYGLEEELKTLYVNVESGEDVLPSECVPMLTGNAVTNLVKIGGGKLSVSENLTSYTGHITVAEGIYSFTTNVALGKLSNDAGSVYVEDGATLDYSPQAKAGGWYTKRIEFSGRGVDGMGALSFSGPAVNERMCFGSNLVMRADALIKNNKSEGYLYQTGGSYPIWLDMNGHTLTFAGNTVVLGCLNVVNPGHIIVSNHTFYINAGNNNFGGGPENTFTYRNTSGYLKFTNQSGKTPWTFRPEALRVITFDTANTSTNQNYWTGPVELSGGQRFEVQPKTGHFSLKGAVKGNGWISVRGTDDGGHFHLFSGENSFTGGAVGYLATYHLWNDGALPADGGSLSLTNGGVRLENPDVTYTLPVLELCKSNSVTGGKGTWRKVVKTGTGTAVWDSMTGSDLLDVQGGTVRFATSPRAQLAGLIEGRRTYYTANTAIDADWKALTVATNGVTLKPNAYYNFSHHLWTDPWPSDQTSSSRRYTVSYTGYIWNNEKTNVTWSFAGQALTHMGVTIDHTKVFRFTGVGSGTVQGNVTVSPGPHHFDVRGYCTALYQDNPKDSRLTWPNYHFAVGFDPLGRGSTNQADYRKLVDLGDGSLFTWDIPDRVTEGVTTVPGTDIVVGAALPVFRRMRFAPGTGAEFRYNYIVEGLEGFPAITGATEHFTISSNWTVRAAEIIAGNRLSTPGRLVFAPGATISLDGTLPAFDSYPQTFLIARSEIPDESLPEIVKGKGCRWTVRRSDDGLDVELVGNAKGLKIILR